MGNILGGDKYFEGSRESYPPIPLNSPQKAQQLDFPKNEIWTTKYNIITFLPKVLYEQFRKFTSVYFLIVCILSFFPAISPVNPWSSVSGLLFILGVSMIREAVEDFFRLKADLSSNRRRFTTIEAITGKQVSTRCQNIRVGDLVHLKANQQVPADLVVLASALADTVCYIETAQLDGETNLKLRRGPPGTAGFSVNEVARMEGSMECDVPQHELYKFKGTIEIRSLGDYSERDSIISDPEWDEARKTDDERLTSARMLALPPSPALRKEGSDLARHFQTEKDEDLYDVVVEVEGASPGPPRLTPKDRTSSLIGLDATGPVIRANVPSISSLGEENMLQRGSVIRNTPWIVGIVAYAGLETKMALNTKTPPSKFSSLDKRINKYVLLIFVLQILVNFVCAVFAGVFEGNVAPNLWYLQSHKNPLETSVFSFFSYFILMSYLIPISLVVTLEVTKVVQGRFMEWDQQMHYERRRMTVKTSNLNDELGLVQYLFSDKTGTLTQNQMDFKKVSVRGRICHDASQGLLFDMFQNSATDKEADEVKELLLCLALCHSVVPDKPEGSDELVYKAASPDEEALCRGARENHFVFLHRDSGGVILMIDQKEVRVEVLCTMPFSSERRRMSVIVRLPNGKIRMYTKGADSTILARLSKKEDQRILTHSDENLEIFSQEGLRTLVLASKDLTKEQYRAFSEKYSRASNLIANREIEVEKVCDQMERDFFIVGCTAIEDKLQEYVPETIAYLLDAGIRVWVITGDKQATAINIGYSTRLLTKDTIVFKLNAESENELIELIHRSNEQCDEAIRESMGGSGYNRMNSSTSSGSQISFEEEDGPHPPFAMVIDGASLQFGLEHHPQELLSFAQRCHSVICCRVAPLQKAAVVKLVKDSLDCITLSIGDGGNDVSMIQEANIGVGIYGKEGSQAARSSDYAIHRFYHVRRLLTVHGRYSLVRNALLTHYSFYKNTAIFMSQIWFSFFSGCSGQSLYDDWIMTFFNIYITALPPFILGVFEKDISDVTIAKYPQTYSRTQNNKIFTLWTLLIWLSSAFYHSLVLFFGAYFLFYDGSQLENGQDSASLSMMGMWMIIAGVIVIFTKLFFEVHCWTVPMHLSVWFSLLLFFMTVGAENSIAYLFPSQYFVLWKTFESLSFWLWVILTVAICFTPDIITKYVLRQYYPQPYQLLQEKEVLDKEMRMREGERLTLLANRMPSHSPVKEEEERQRGIGPDEGEISLPGDYDYEN